MSVLSGIAKGFLSLLDSNNFGEQPRVLVDNVSPVVDIAPLYLLQKQRFVFGGTAGNLAAGFNSTPVSSGVNLIVPTGEIWLVHHVDASVIPPVGGSGLFTPAIQAEGTTIPLADAAAYVASTRNWIVGKLAAPLWLVAGSELGILAQGVAGATPASLQAIVSKLRA